MASQEEFQKKVLESLKKNLMAVDLSDQPEEEIVEVANTQTFQAESYDFTAFGAPQSAGPTSGGNKDIVILPGAGGTQANSASQINFYWNSPSIPDTTGIGQSIRATLFNYATSATNPVLAIGGWNGTTNYLPSATYAGGSGTTAKIWFDPFLGRIETDYLGFNSGVADTNVAGVLFYDSSQSVFKGGVGSGVGKTIAFLDNIPAANSFFYWSDGTNIAQPDAAMDTFTFVAGTGITLLVNASGDSASFGATNVPNASLTNSTTTLGSSTLTLGGTALTVTGLNALTSTNITVSGSTASTTSTTGALLVTGGVGIGGSLSVGNSILLDSGYGSVTTTQFAAIFAKAIGSNATSLMQVKGNDGTVGMGMKAQTGTNSLIYSYGQIDFRVNSTIRDNDTPSGGNTFLTLSTVGVLTASGTTASTGFSTGAVVVTGGVGIGGSLWTSSANLSSISGVTLYNGTITGALSGNATTSTTSGSAGTSVTAGSAGTSVTAGSAGTAVNAGSAGTSVTAGSAGTAVNAGAAGTAVNAGSAGTAVNAGAAGKWLASRSVSFATGDVTGSFSIDGTANVSNVVLTIGADSVALGTDTTGAYASEITTSGSGISATPAVGADGTAYTIYSNATPTNTNSTLVFRDAAGLFAAAGATFGSLQIDLVDRTVYSSSGNLILDSSGGTVNVNDNLTIAGDLTVQGTTITVDSTVSTIVDPIITIGGSIGGTNPGTDDNKDRGIEFKYFSGTAKTGFFGFDDSTGFFTFIPDGTNASEVFSGTVGVIDATRITGSASSWTNARTVTFATGDVTGSFSIDGSANVSNVALTIAADSVALGTDTTGNYVSNVQASGSGISIIGTAAENATFTVNSNATSSNTNSTIVLRDGSGNFSAGTITANLTGTATSAQVINTTTDTSNTLYLLGSRSSTGFAGTAVFVDSNISALGNTISAITFSGNATTSTSAGTAGTATNAGSAGTSVTAGSAGTSVTAGLAVSSTNAGLAVSSTNAGLAVSSTNAGLAVSSTNAGLAVSSTNAGLAVSSTNAGLAVSSTNAGLAVSSTNAGLAVSSTNAGLAVSSTNTANTNIVLDTTSTIYMTGSRSNASIGSTPVYVLSGVSALGNTVTATTFSGNATTATTSGAAGQWIAPITFSLGGDLSGSVSFTGSGNTTLTATIGANSVALGTDTTGDYVGNVLAGSGIATTGATTGEGTVHTLSIKNAASLTNNTVPKWTTSSTQFADSAIVDDGTTVAVSRATTVTSSALTNGTYLTITTAAGDDNSTSDFFIKGLNSSATSKFSVDANGNLRATTKSFDIEHPTKPGMRLVYGVLEGPEHGVYHRGTVEGKGKIVVELPEYWHLLAGSNYSIQLTSWGNYNTHIVEKTENNFTIQLTGDPLTRLWKTIKVDYIIHGSRLDAPLVIEQK